MREREDNTFLNNDNKPQRTVKEVLDVETGEIIVEDEYFKLPESVIIADRRRLQEVINGQAPKKYVCAYCEQLVRLIGRRHGKGMIHFFAHLHSSADCEIKTKGSGVVERKYSNIRYTERHKFLKEQLAKYLSTTPYVTNVEIEKKKTSDNSDF